MKKETLEKGISIERGIGVMNSLKRALLDGSVIHFESYGKQVHLCEFPKEALGVE